MPIATQSPDVLQWLSWRQLLCLVYMFFCFALSSCMCPMFFLFHFHSCFTADEQLHELGNYEYFSFFSSTPFHFSTFLLAVSSVCRNLEGLLETSLSSPFLDSYCLPRMGLGVRGHIPFPSCWFSLSS